MAHYAFIDSNNVVIKVITGVDENETQIDTDGTEIGGSTEAWEAFYKAQSWHDGLTCKRTSVSGSIRKQYAGIGFTYDEARDEFVTPQPFESWTLDQNNDWQPPTPKPDDDYYWDETTQTWLPFEQL